LITAEEARRFVKDVVVIEPRKEYRKLYDKLYDVFEKSYQALVTVFDELANLQKSWKEGKL